LHRRIYPRIGERILKIKKFSANGYRSLWDLKLSELGNVNVFFGENNSGKSNILEALETIFRVERAELPVSGFIRDQLSNFVDNFTINKVGVVSPKICFECKIDIENTDVNRLPSFSSFLEKCGFIQRNIQSVDLEIEITPVTQNQANRVLKTAKVNKQIMWDASLPPNNAFFPNIPGKYSAEEKETAATELFSYLSNSFSVIHTERFSGSLVPIGNGLTPIPTNLQGFKEWFRILAESRGESYKTYELIQQQFQNPPFNYGTVRPISEKGIDLVVLDKSGRELTLGRLGTGVQQILILLSQIAAYTSSSKNKIIGIEELELNLSPEVQIETIKMIQSLVNEPNISGINQVFLTGHSPYICSRANQDFFAVSVDDNVGTTVKHGPNAVKQMIVHYKYDFLSQLLIS
jgi:predicted ATP-dependent endonuclease of OLD family